MKYILFTLFLLAELTAFSQTNVYHPFPDSNAVWNEELVFYDYHPTPMFIENYSITISGDTTIKNTIYHKIATPYVDHHDFPPYWTGVMTHSGYRGALRQDINAKKVFYVPGNDSLEILLYDFNLNVGDTVADTMGCTITIYSIDSILIGNNYRKRWILSSTPQPTEIIEGIGGTRGLFNSWFCNFDGFSTNLNCLQQDGLPLYPNTTNPCDLINSVTLFPNRNNLIEIFPNPIHTSAIIKTRINFAQLNIYNSMGSCVLSQQVETADIYFDRGLLPNGIYYFKLLSRDNRNASETIIIN